MRKATSSWQGASLPDVVHEVLDTPGRRLDAAERAPFESRFGADFSSVRVYADARAAQSAHAVRAHAYTVGERIVFGHQRYAPQTPAGQRLLAHELTHVVQQRGGSGGGPEGGAHEATADRIEQAWAQGAALPAIGAAGTSLARDEYDGQPAATAPAAPDAAQTPAVRAGRAEVLCDIGALCALRFASPDVVDVNRVRRVVSRCRPSSRFVSDPCFSLDLLGGLNSPRGVPGVAPGPRREPEGPESGPTLGEPPSTSSGGAAAAAPGGLSLPSTKINFAFGGVMVTVDLPASLNVRLPVKYQGRKLLEFSLDASPSGFSFTGTFDLKPQFRIISRAGLTKDGERSAGLSFQLTRTVCHGVSAEAGRSQLQEAGERLRKAIVDVGSPPAADAGEVKRTFTPEAQLGEVIAALANINSTIERVSAPCSQVPTASIDFGVKAPPGDLNKASGNVTLTIPF